MSMTIAEGAHYDHDEHGPVVIVIAEGGEVFLRSLTKTAGRTDTPAHYRESEDRFREHAAPRKRTIDVPTTTLGLSTKPLRGA